MGHKRLLTTTIGTAILATAVLLWAWPHDEAAPSLRPTEADQELAAGAPAAGAPAAGIAARVVHTEEVRETAARRSVRFAGVTRAARRAALSFAAPARLVSRPVQVGDRVAAGQTLATLDDREFRHAVAAAQAALAELEVRLAQASRDLTRAQQLADAEAATAEEVERTAALAEALTAGRDAARVRLDDAGRLLDETLLRAPFAATVTAVLLEPGEWAMPGRPVVELAGDGALEIEIEVPETVIAGLAPGQEVTVELPYQRQEVGGRLTSVTRAAIGPGRLFPVVVELVAGAPASPGMTAEVRFEVESTAAKTVPLRAVLNPGSGTPSLFRVRDGRAEQVPVELGQLQGEEVIVHAQLTAGDRVVVVGHTALADGDPVCEGPVYEMKVGRQGVQ